MQGQSFLPWFFFFGFLLVADLEECAFSGADMRQEVQEIFKQTPKNKQVMMFSATLDKSIRPVCKKFMVDVRFLSIWALFLFFLL